MKSSEEAKKPSQMDAYAPAEIAQRIENVGLAKVKLPFLPMFALAVLAGAFIALGGMFYLVVMTDPELGFGPSRLLGGVAFSLGLILVLVGGAELFTGNSLIVMGWAHGRIRSADLLRNWAIVYVGNLVGAVGMAVLAWWSGFQHLGGDGVQAVALNVAGGKVALPFFEAFIKGVLCNVLVCLAVWLCFAAHSVSSKILAIIFPVSAFVALGLEHSIANMFFIPLGILLDSGVGHFSGLDIGGFVGNLIPVTLGNIIGGGVFVALTYKIIYLRDQN